MSINPARSRAARESWDDPYAHAMRCIALRDGWHMRRRQMVEPVPSHMFNIFTCPCGAECVGTSSGPRLCSNCRAERCA